MVNTTKDINQAAILAENEALRKELEKLKQCKRYGLVWEDHPEALDKKNIIPLLAKDDGLSLPVIADKKQNYLIEGDNYHALKALQHTHRSAIDVIYIDPPYNTGNEFVYNDKIVDKEDSFRHSKWLSFMEKRLKLARELMSEDGVIFISIDDNEQAQLKLLCDAVFGEANFVSDIKWRCNPRGRTTSKFIGKVFENILMYVKDIQSFHIKDSQIKDVGKLKAYKFKDDIGKYKRGYPLHNGTKDFHIDNRPNLCYTIYYNPETKDVYTADEKIENDSGVFTISSDRSVTKDGYYRIIPKYNEGYGRQRVWRWQQTTFMTKYKTEIIFVKEGSHYYPYSKQRLDGDSLYELNKDFIDGVFTDNGTRELFDLGLQGEFSFPKPIELCSKLISMHPNKSATVLDFFAGSGTTGHAVMELNKEDGGDRNFILCTNNEVSDDLVRTHFFNEGHITKNNKTEFNKFVKEHPDVHEAFLNSAEYESLGIARAITRERLKRVIEGYTTPKGKDVEGLPNNLTYLKTKEFDKKEQYGFDRNILANLAYNSHILKYPELNYESFQVDAFTDIDAIKLTTTKQPVAFVNTRDRESLADIVEQLTNRFGNKVIIETLESYFN